MERIGGYSKMVGESNPWISSLFAALVCCFFFQAEDGIRDKLVTGVQTCALPICSVNPRIAVVVSYVGNWDDLSAGKEQALAQIGRRTDVIFQNADAAGLGVFQAAKEAGSAYVIGANADQNAVAPEVTLGSVVIDLRHAFLLVAREVRSGQFQ